LESAVQQTQQQQHSKLQHSADFKSVQTLNILDLNRKRKAKQHQEKTKYSKNNQVVNNRTRFNSPFTFGNWYSKFSEQPNVFFLPRISFYIAIKRNFPLIFHFINK